MALPPGIRRLFGFPFASRRPEEHVATELEDHIQRTAEDLTARGMDPGDARREAERRFGPRDPVAREVARLDARREADTDTRGRRFDFGRDLRYALRRLARSPGFTAVAILTLALGLGATITVFTLADGAIFKQLPYHEPARIVRLFEQRPAEGRDFIQLTIADLNDWRSQSKTLTGVSGFRFRPVGIGGDDGATLVDGAEVSSGFFDMLGVAPMLGRTFRPGEEVAGAPAVVLLSHSLWRRHFAADTGLIDRSITVNGLPATVIGVLPSTFHDPVGGGIEIWTPGDFSSIAEDQARARRMHFLAGFARLADGVTLEGARTELTAIGRRLEATYPGQNHDHRPQLVPVALGDVRNARPVLFLTLSAAGLLLLLMCANLANLALARALSQRRDIAVRAALGAGRRRLTRGIVIEQGLLVTIGGTLGFAAAWLATRGLVSLLAGSLPRAERVGIDLRVAGFALAVTAATMLVTAVIPAFLAVRMDLSAVLRSGDRGGTADRGSHRIRHVLVGVQVGLAVLLSAGSALVVRSLQALLDAELGFEPSQVMAFTTPLPRSTYGTATAVMAFQKDILDRLGRMQGARSVGAAYSVPMRNTSTTSLRVREAPASAEAPAPEVGYNAATAGYFPALGIPLLAGRLFDERDRQDAPPVVVVNQILADRFFPGESAVGRFVWAGPSRDAPRVEVIGVVGNIRRASVQEEPVPEMYFALTQDVTSSPTFVVRVTGDAEGSYRAIRQAVAAVDPTVPIGNLGPLQDVVDVALVRPRFLGAILTTFAGLALLLSAIGVHGVIAFLVAERSREFGVRRALGATAGVIVRNILGVSLLPVGFGLAVGLGGALLLGPVLRSLLYGVSPSDPVTLGGVVLVTGLAAVAGSLAPARRAVTVDPLIALRE